MQQQQLKRNHASMNSCAKMFVHHLISTLYFLVCLHKFHSANRPSALHIEVCEISLASSSTFAEQRQELQPSRTNLLDVPRSPAESDAHSRHHAQGNALLSVKTRGFAIAEKPAASYSITEVQRIAISDFDKTALDGGIDCPRENDQVITGDGSGARTAVGGSCPIDYSRGFGKARLPSFDRFAGTSAKADAFDLPVEISARCRITVAHLFDLGKRVLYCEYGPCKLTTYMNRDESLKKTKVSVEPFDVPLSSMFIRRKDETHGLADKYRLSIELEAKNGWPPLDNFLHDHASSRSGLVLDSDFDVAVDGLWTAVELKALLKIRDHDPVDSAESLTVKLCWSNGSKDPGLWIDTKLAGRYRR